MKMSFLLLLTVAPCLAGCGDQLEKSEGPKAPGSVITERRLWQASGDLENCSAAIDGSLSTAAVSKRNTEGSQITIDLGKPCVFNLVILEHGDDEFGFCRRMAMLTSMDGENFVKVCESTDSRRAAYITPITTQLARYVRLQIVTPGARPWAVAEIVLR